MALEVAKEYLDKIMLAIPEDYRFLVTLTLYTFFIALYAIFIWKFYKFLASKNIIELHLKKYNYSNHPGLEKFLAMILYAVEYLIILPFLVLFWFAILSMFILFLSKSSDVQQILLISAAIIASTRITAYVSEDLSRDIAKIFPFTVLAIFLLDPNFFNLPSIIDKAYQIPSLFSQILFFLVFIFIVEFLLRIIYAIAEFIKSFGPESSSEQS
jgi:hypothetical protein